jgi:hypothetical protein
VWTQADGGYVQVRRLEAKLRKVIDQVFALENRSHQLKLTLDEREKEVSLHREMQRLEEKACEKSRRKVALTSICY